MNSSLFNSMGVKGFAGAGCLRAFGVFLGLDRCFSVTSALISDGRFCLAADFSSAMVGFLRFASLLDSESDIRSGSCFRRFLRCDDDSGGAGRDFATSRRTEVGNAEDGASRIDVARKPAEDGSFFTGVSVSLVLCRLVDPAGEPLGLRIFMDEMLPSLSNKDRGRAGWAGVATPVRLCVLADLADDRRTPGLLVLCDASAGKEVCRSA